MSEAQDESGAPRIGSVERLRVVFILALPLMVWSWARGTEQWTVDLWTGAAFQAIAALLALIVGILASLRQAGRGGRGFLWMAAGFLIMAAADAALAMLSMPGPIRIMADGTDRPQATWDLIWAIGRGGLGLAMTVAVAVNVLERETPRTIASGDRLVAGGWSVVLVVVFVLGRSDAMPTAPAWPMILAGLLLIAAVLGAFLHAPWRSDGPTFWTTAGLVMLTVVHGLLSLEPQTEFQARQAMAGSASVVAGLLFLIGFLQSLHRSLASAEFHALRASERARRLEEREDQLARILDGMAQGMVLVDSQRRIRDINQRAQELFQFREQEILGRDIRLLVPAHHWQEADEFIEAFARGEVSQSLRLVRDAEGKRRDGSTFPIELGISAFQGAEGPRFVGLVRDLSGQRRQERALRSLVEELEAVLLHAAHGIVVLDGLGRIRRVNPAGEGLMGCRAEQAEGRTLESFFQDGAPPWGELPGAGRTALECEGEIQRSVGEPLPVAVSLAGLLDESGALEGHIAIIRDLSERKAVERMQAQFMSNISHELRTPLTALLASLRMLPDALPQETDAATRRLVEVARSSGERLTRLVDDLLDLDRLDAGRLDVRRERVDLARIVREVAAGHESQAQSKGSRIQVVGMSEEAPAMGDADRIAQVVANLISNAIKFGPEEDEVRISLRREEAAWRLSVSDHGPGIPEAFRSRVFGRFAQADESGTRVSGGSGLGLAISRSLVERMGGRIDFRCPEGGGTVFQVWLPLA